MRTPMRALVLMGCLSWHLTSLAAPESPQAPDRPAVAKPADPALVDEGRRLYMDGVRADGSALVADRQDAQPLRGSTAACVACHKRAGMGGIEGDIIVPPINAPALYAGNRLRDRVIIAMDPRRGRAFNPSHPPYDAASLTAAIRDGVHVSGRPMHVLMPRYRINDHEAAALKAFLDQLSTHYPPGVTDTTAAFATVIAPGVDPARKAAFLKSMTALIDQKNANTIPGHRHMVSPTEGMLNMERSWSLDVWELQGSPDTWVAQMQSAYSRHPVLAILSGLGDDDWAPVQTYCESEKIPCWFPSIANPPAGAADQTYSLYFSNGVHLEAQVLARYFQDLSAKDKPRRIVQLAGGDVAQTGAAREFATAMGKGIATETRTVGPDHPLAAALGGLKPGDALVLWLRDADLASLASVARPDRVRVYGSSSLVRGVFDAFPESWRTGVDLVYPYELPEKRLFNMATFHSWLELRNLPLVDEAMQSEVFFSVGYMSYTMSEMLDNVYRDCLIDRGETMVRRREMLRAEEELMVRQGGRPPPKATAAKSTYAPGALYGVDATSKLAQKNTPKLGDQTGTTIYPHLELATGQRFASKGAYLVHLLSDHGKEVIGADSDWIVP